MVSRFVLRPYLFGLLLMATSVLTFADEGMWVFNNLPLGTLKARHGFEPPAGWADHLRSSAVRFNNGGSGSFVSADGLIMTNHHVGADTLAKLGTKEKDYYRDGFFAKTHGGRGQGSRPRAQRPGRHRGRHGPREREGHCGARRRLGREGQAAGDGRDREGIDRQDGLRSDVVTLYQGGQYHLYTYKKYTDVRLVFAPNSTRPSSAATRTTSSIPRYDLDVCFFRAYENGKPARPPHHLKWSKNGSKEGDLVFVAGHPGRTDRLNTVASLEYLRDVAFPTLLDYLHTKEAFLLDYGRRGPERTARPKEELFSIQNSRKARVGGLNGLRDADFMARKTQAENELRSRSRGRPEEERSLWRRVGPDRPGPEGRGPDREAVLPAGIHAHGHGIGLDRALQDRLATWYAWPRRSPSRTPRGSRNTATRRWNRSSSPSSRRPRSIPSSRRPSSRRASPTGGSRFRATRWSSRSCGAESPKRPRDRSSAIPSSPTWP